MSQGFKFKVTIKTKIFKSVTSKLNKNIESVHKRRQERETMITEGTNWRSLENKCKPKYILSFSLNGNRLNIPIKRKRWSDCTFKLVSRLTRHLKHYIRFKIKRTEKIYCKNSQKRSQCSYINFKENRLQAKSIYWDNFIITKKFIILSLGRYNNSTSVIT